MNTRPARRDVAGVNFALSSAVSPSCSSCTRRHCNLLGFLRFQQQRTGFVWLKQQKHKQMRVRFSLRWTKMMTEGLLVWIPDQTGLAEVKAPMGTSQQIADISQWRHLVPYTDTSCSSALSPLNFLSRNFCHEYCVFNLMISSVTRHIGFILRQTRFDVKWNEKEKARFNVL